MTNIEKLYLQDCHVTVLGEFFAIEERKGGINKNGQPYEASTRLKVRFDDIENCITFKAEEGSREQRLIRALGDVRRGQILTLDLLRSYKAKSVWNVEYGVSWTEVTAKDRLVNVRIYREDYSESEGMSYELN